MNGGISSPSSLLAFPQSSMRDAELSSGLIETAELLVSLESPSEAALRRAISASYYAVFHALAKLVADSLIGEDPNVRPTKAWIEVYCGLNRGTCRGACANAKSVGFPDEIHGFAEAFVQLQAARHEADYDPTYAPDTKMAQFLVRLADVNIRMLREVGKEDKKAFAAWVLITGPGAKAARDKHR